MASQVHDTDSGSFEPLAHFSDEINGKVVESEIEGGVYLSDVSEGAEVKVQTENRSYTIVNRGGGRGLISGHPEFCPEPVEGFCEGVPSCVAAARPQEPTSALFFDVV